MTPVLSAEARNALVNTANRQGATIPARTPQAAVAELDRLGIIGRGRGLTRHGTIVAARVVSAVLNEAF